MTDFQALPTCADTLDAAAAPDINTVIRHRLGAGLQEYFSLPTVETLPERLVHLVGRLDAAVAASGQTGLDGLRDDMIRAMPALRAFAFSLVGEASRADDLVQETLVKAWANRDKFTAGTNFTAWLFTILRNQFYTEVRKRKREVEDADGTHAATLTALPEQEGVVSLRALREKLAQIPEAQRIALLMVGAEGYTYEEAAERLHCKVGTVKSRVSRARAYLAEILGLDDGGPLKPAL
ncbi:sigma-70 family RNA polymerase sigma factor [Methylobacterium sp.]|jgi:RNA polymerase sigma-70 factor (ECF subfamily)|uniref:sigma-70 family RNA polymerase sigma factor n=1 Tax=Methylobacterium sp. TaxID=409 RepID=UPI00263A17B8|nr:sigma-70 family RNA polymerase sigma factor [Methylobacterium sp.]MDB5644484.1 polymerase ECF-type sigma factor [Methylobacterium sp.]